MAQGAHELREGADRDNGPPSQLARKIADRTAKVGVVGLGYVGLPTMVASANAGFEVTGLDIDLRKVEQINRGHSYIEDVLTSTLAELITQKKVSATDNYSALENMDVIVICVPTPVNTHKEPELGPLEAAVQSLADHTRGEQLVILQSTSYPGTTEELVLKRLTGSGREVGKDFYLAFSPERIDPANQDFSLNNIPKIVGGVTPQCGDMACRYFSAFVEQVIPVSSPRVAELTKLLENIFRSVNIALVNELAELCQRMGIDIWEVIDAASTKPFGFMPFYPGIGVGGHCIPVDPFYLSWKAREHDFYVNFIELAAKTNDNRPYYAVSRIVDILAERGNPIKGARLLLLGLSFKKNIGDIRNSPALRVAELLAGKGALISYNDPYVPEATIDGRTRESVELDTETPQASEAVVLLVDHACFDLGMIVDRSHLFIDAAGATRVLGPRPNVVNL